MNYLDLPEIATQGWQSIYGSGTDIGALVAGMTVVEPVIDRFLAEPRVPSSIREEIASVRKELSSLEWTAPELLDWCLETFPRLSAAWNGV